MHVKKGDKVMVISGKDKGKTGTILAAYPKKDRVIVEGVNIVKKTRETFPGKSTGRYFRYGSAHSRVQCDAD